MYQLYNTHFIGIGQIMYNVHQHWDKLKVCAVGKNYPPEFYSFIKNPRLRNLFEKIAIETEEDNLNLIKTLKKFGIKVVRPNVPDIMPEDYYQNNLRIPGPVSMNPRDQCIMIGNKFFVFPFERPARKASGRIYKDTKIDFSLTSKTFCNWWEPIINEVQDNNVEIINYTNTTPEIEKFLSNLQTNGIVRVGYDLYFGKKEVGYDKKVHVAVNWLTKKHFTNYRAHYISTGGHVDGCFTPVKPGLIISRNDMETYDKTFPGWEVVYIRHEPDSLYEFGDVRTSKQGSWLIPNTKADDELIEFVEKYLNGWTGNIIETNFDVNSLVIDENNILVSEYNKTAFDAYERYGVTPHIVSLRHKFFWDSGLSCMTTELHREGTLQNIFPERD
jgi:N-dimethylarginine dimethylaminohydrolase